MGNKTTVKFGKLTAFHGDEILRPTNLVVGEEMTELRTLRVVITIEAIAEEGYELAPQIQKALAAYVVSDHFHAGDPVTTTVDGTNVNITRSFVNIYTPSPLSIEQIDRRDRYR